MNKILLNNFISVTIYDQINITFHVLDIIYINHYTGCTKLKIHIGNDYTACLCICDNYADCGLL